ncbi:MULTISPECIES: hypothetical protein [unclassified Rhodococcus (in: high G+C Gram-positive bacteria)]|uniref:hypothetical protein n=1 Tax=unclassified Rhodococcus (in: high G+C Gram-positive bacteria) TaxID=192944 RepID=UPI00117BBEF5|nr:MULTISPECIES: hypothetical protein [unclassified Rhodococcus (in: high G+C Gram-positive bacteria)]
MSPEKRPYDGSRLPSHVPHVAEQQQARRDDERQRAREVRDAARLATLWMRDAIRAIEDLDYVDRVGFLAEGVDRLDAVAAELDQRLERLQTSLRAVLDMADDVSPRVGWSKLADVNVRPLDPLVIAANTAHEMSPMARDAAARRNVERITERVNNLYGNDALRTEPDVPKPGQHLKSRPSGKPAGLSDRHGGALNSTAAPDGSGPGGGG